MAEGQARVPGRPEKAASATSPNPPFRPTRTYRVEVQLPNADGAIRMASPRRGHHPDVGDARDARAALGAGGVVSGDIGVRTVDTEARVGFVPVTIVEDDQGFMWLSGVPNGARVIVQGQDFVREGNLVEPSPRPGGLSAQR